MSTITSKDRSITLRESDALRAMPAMNPQALIAAAIEKGASVETLERLVALAKDMRQVSAREAFFKAKTEFQKRCPPITKSKTAKIASRTGASYSYNYAPLDEIIAKVDPLLSELGFSKSWKQRPEQNGISANCVLSHEMGHEEESGFITMPVGAADGRMNPAQLVGSALTYARRYSLLAILGLAPEDDDDAHGTESNGGEARRAAAPRAYTATITAPAIADPDDPALVAESNTLFPDPEKQALIAEIKRLGKNIPAGDKAEAATTYLGVGVNLEQADVSALADLKRWCEARAKR